MAAAGGRVVFNAWGSGTFAGIWSSDGTDAGTVRLSPTGFDSFGQSAGGGNVVYFVATPLGGAPQLWMTDGVPGGTLVSIAPGSRVPPLLTTVGDTLYYARGSELVRTDGTQHSVSRTDLHRDRRSATGHRRAFRLPAPGRSGHPILGARHDHGLEPARVPAVGGRGGDGSGGWPLARADPGSRSPPPVVERRDRGRHGAPPGLRRVGWRHPSAPVAGRSVLVRADRQALAERWNCGGDPARSRIGRDGRLRASSGRSPSSRRASPHFRQ